jgi:hypothetical protein
MHGACGGDTVQVMRPPGSKMPTKHRWRLQRGHPDLDSTAGLCAGSRRLRLLCVKASRHLPSQRLARFATADGATRHGEGPAVHAALDRVRGMCGRFRREWAASRNSRRASGMAAQCLAAAEACPWVAFRFRVVLCEWSDGNLPLRLGRLQVTSAWLDIGRMAVSVRIAIRRRRGGCLVPADYMGEDDQRPDRHAHRG